MSWQDDEGLLSELEQSSIRSAMQLIALDSIMGMYPTSVAGQWIQNPFTDPSTKAEADELRAKILQLPRGFLAKLYVDLHRTNGFRIQHGQAEGEADKYYGGLK